MAWTVRLAAQAELDFVEILAWTVENFGEIQAEIYAETLTSAIEALHDGPLLAGAQARNDIESGIRTLHVARQGRRGRHFLVFRQIEDRCIDVLRLLHDGMDLARHIPIEPVQGASRSYGPQATLRDWEQGRYKPPGGVMCLLKLLAAHPELTQELAA